MGKMIAVGTAAGLCLCIVCSKPGESGQQAAAARQAVSVGPCEPSRAATEPTTIYGMVDALVNEVRDNLGDSAVPPLGAVKKSIDSMALLISSRLFMVSDPEPVLEQMKKILFVERRLQPMENSLSIDDVLPQYVLRNGRGSCLGISLVMLMIAEKIDQPLHGVLLPGHFFVRFDNGAFKMNIEPLRNGIERTDEWYRDFFKVEAGSDVCLVNLTKRQTAAVLRYNIANFYRDKQRYDLAEAGYRAVVKDLPQFTDAWGNLGVTLDAQGRTDDALAAFAMVKKLDPSLDRLSDNMAVIHIRSRQYQKAYDLYSKTLAQRPADPDLLYGFALACFGVKKYERAVQSIEKALEVRADFPEARKLLEKIQASM